MRVREWRNEASHDSRLRPESQSGAASPPTGFPDTNGRLPTTSWLIEKPVLIERHPSLCASNPCWSCELPAALPLQSIPNVSHRRHGLRCREALNAVGDYALRAVSVSCNGAANRRWSEDVQAL
jgi:hypothetical protein